MKFETVEQLQEYLKLDTKDTKVLMNALPSFIYIKEHMCHLKIFKGNRGWSINYSSNDKKEGTPNITRKSMDLDDVLSFALEYLIQYKFHYLQNKDRNIFIDMLTKKN